VISGIWAPFLTSRPELTDDWHPTRNADLSPDVLGVYSTARVWWRCSACGHEWQATVKSRAACGAGCPRCYSEDAARRAREMHAQRVPERPLSATRPELAAELDPARNRELDASALTVGSGRRVWWRCRACGHEWQTRSATGPAVAAVRLAPADTRHRVAHSRSCTPICALNGTPPATASSTPRLSAAAPERRPGGGAQAVGTSGGQESNLGRDSTPSCPQCYRANVLVPPLAAARPELLKELHPDRNGQLDPSTLRQWSWEPVWWRCSTCGHQWQTSPANRVRGRGCPSCARRQAADRRQRTREGRFKPTTTTLDGPGAA
jgi:rubrerythrin